MFQAGNGLERSCSTSLPTNGRQPGPVLSMSKAAAGCGLTCTSSLQCLLIYCPTSFVHFKLHCLLFNSLVHFYPLDLPFSHSITCVFIFLILYVCEKFLLWGNRSSYFWWTNFLILFFISSAFAITSSKFLPLNQKIFSLVQTLLAYLLAFPDLCLNTD